MLQIPNLMNLIVLLETTNLGLNHYLIPRKEYSIL
ncbi:protein of unknown function [Mesotoga infera]|uniref:Uncharacterized protein n=1 Tax=Mesotoga infera TaxID=1236046 RepID=A0A7Z7LF77_9BACT|nr:protein of unknown function [Mesotoga infera]